jgi:hypothetical protein
MQKKEPNKPKDETIYLIEFEDGSRKKVTVPANWRVTFGPVVSFGADRRPQGNRYTVPVALRFYEDETKQRAIFTHVTNFRDMSIPILEEKVQRKDKVGRVEVDGAYQNINLSAEVKQWTNPDDESVTTPGEMLAENIVIDDLYEFDKED